MMRNQNDCLQESWQAVRMFWANVPADRYTHPGDDALSFAMTECAEAESRWLRATNPQYVQNSDKGRDEETVMAELGDTLYMLITFQMWCGIDQHTATVMPKMKVYRDWFDYVSHLFGMARWYRSTQYGTRLCHLTIHAIIAEILSYPNFDCYEWVRYTLNKVANKHGLGAWDES